ncbi:MAG TPA: hypothetical protein VGR81_13280 [Candidatus Acidoferrales bacterium]|nr:hypothetical protein [Candidatus Acidoferrales bacterium]
MTEDEADKIVATMFDELVSTKIEGGKVTVETEVLSPDPEEVEDAVADLVRSWRRFKEMDASVAATSGANLGIEWWRAVKRLALADFRLKEMFCGPDRSARSMRKFHKYKLKLIDGRRYRTDA